jgi:SAM-dependent MidA family methyltransferase
LTLREYIESEIRDRGHISFARFMELCLYGASDSPPGYYARSSEQFGRGGDFYTSSDVHAVFGRLLARQFHEMWQAIDSPDALAIIELGPGRGLFAEDVLAWIEKKFPELASRLTYFLVETSASLRERLTDRFADGITAGQVFVLSSLEEAFAEAGASVIVFGNEFFDALPAEVLDHRGELRIASSEGKFIEQFVSPSSEVVSFVEQFAVPPQRGERIEAPLVAQDFMQRIARLMSNRQGFCVFVDYGYVRDEMLAGRHLGTVMAYRQHRVSDSPYDAPGEQDITIHVNFTALAETARQHGLDPLAWVSQSQFLIGIGEDSQFADAFEECKLPQEQAKRAFQLKHLITPEGMGETFHVLVLGANVTKEKAARLSGLKFVRPSNQI